MRISEVTWGLELVDESITLRVINTRAHTQQLNSPREAPLNFTILFGKSKSMYIHVYIRVDSVRVLSELTRALHVYMWLSD